MTTVDDPGLLDRLERYLDTVPRASAVTEEVGPFTLFLRSSPSGWNWYARPRLGGAGEVTVADVAAVRARQRELGVPESVEWVADLAPDLAAVADAAGLRVLHHPLLVLGPLRPPPPVPGVEVTVLTAEDPRLAGVGAVVDAGFAGTDEVAAPPPDDPTRSRVAAGLLRVVGAFERDGAAPGVAAGPVGGGSHAPRGEVTELTGIAVLPRARRRGVGAALTAALAADAAASGVTTVFLSAGSLEVAQVYRRVGFVRVGTACVAEAAP